MSGGGRLEVEDGGLKVALKGWLLAIVVSAGRRHAINPTSAILVRPSLSVCGHRRVNDTDTATT